MARSRKTKADSSAATIGYEAQLPTAPSPLPTGLRMSVELKSRSPRRKAVAATEKRKIPDTGGTSE